MNGTPAAASGDTNEGGDNQRRGRGGRGGENRRRAAEGTEGQAPLTQNDAAPVAQVAGDSAEAPREGEMPEGGDGAPRAPRERRSRDRYGRDRRERGPRDANGAPEGVDGETPADMPASEVAFAAASTPVVSQEPLDEAPTRSYFSLPVDAAPAPVVNDAPVAATAPVAAPIPAPVVEAIAPAPVMAPAVMAPVATPVAAPAPLATPAPRAPTPKPQAAEAPAARGLPKVASFSLPMDEMQQVAQSSGLEWVNSNADKVAQVQAAIAAEPKPVHVPREPKPAVVLDDGPLVLVETRKDLRDMQLPFEAR